MQDPVTASNIAQRRGAAVNVDTVPAHGEDSVVPTTNSGGQHLCLIIHCHRPYCFDINQILALPSGFRFHNRFDIQWVHQDLRQDLESLKGQLVLLILRDPDNNKLIPFRWGRLFNVERIAKTVLFDYHLEDLIDYSNDDNVIAEEINARTREFANRHEWLPGEQGRGLTTPAVFRSDVGSGLSTSDANDMKAWGNCVDAVSTAPCYLRMEFLKVVGLFDSDNRRAQVVNETLRVKRNSMYVLSIFEYIPKPGPENESIPLHNLEITSFPDHVTALVPKQQIVGKYDRLEFDLKVLNLGPGERTALAIPYQPDAATTARASATIYLPLSTRPSRHGQLVAALVLAAASLFFMFRPDIGKLSQEVVRNVATVIFILTVSGPSRTLASIWPTWPWGTTQ
jgi:hypothetical protein